ncbi:hypothetical protein OEIGOIKO_03447 [Streptomyces chrestomyceticus JCM 4735]|uniref:Uncharacterized protein n=1 Tax=Streptomyces chrestomyceticus JCM 4735 TaxID=1306181 RepID=A0A7U9KVS6_9ACTN|nr:hypothetical protein [Streptomyces chrestomyceticus]GCD35701.1 hypothetical protein OEIGOIKO_03447 [Streptomyces chrestomyceticus JCM 4735]
MPEQNTSDQDNQNEDQDLPSKGLGCIGCGTTEGHCTDPNRHGLM